MTIWLQDGHARSAVKSRNRQRMRSQCWQGMHNGGGIKEKGPNPNMVSGWVGLGEMLLGQHSPSISISASSSDSIHLIACLLPPLPWQMLLSILPYWFNPHPPIQPMRINTRSKKSWPCPARKRQSKLFFFHRIYRRELIKKNREKGS